MVHCEKVYKTSVLYLSALKNACMQSLTNLFTPRNPSVNLKGSVFSCILETQKARTFAVHIDCTWFAISISVISLFLIQESETTWSARMDALIYPGGDKLWPTRVADSLRSSAFVDLNSQNELYQRNQGTCGYGECNWGFMSFISSFTRVPRRMTKIFTTTSLLCIREISLTTWHFLESRENLTV